MNNKKKQEIPLEAFDNELMHQEIIIPDDFKATIEGNKIILTKTENKDERIKNRLIKLIKMSSEVGGFALHKWEADEMLAWLEKIEKQGEQKPIIEMKSAEESLGIDSETYNKIVDECIYGDDKQESTDKVELKFKVGDWVVSPNDVYWHIDAIQNGRYEVTADTGQCGNWPLDTNIYRLWTIQDAKDGDVLAEDSCIFIIQKLGDNSTAAKTYCTLYDDGDFDDGSILYFDIDSTKPATKEQRDLLFSKMKEAGYEWDAEKKELRKIHVIDEGKAEMDYCFTKMMNGEKVSSAWSEEDEERIKNILLVLGVQVCWNGATGNKENPYQKEIDWLKSLKQRYTWKPSDEQMDALNEKMSKTDEEMINEEMINEEMLKNDEEMLKAAICLIKGVNNDTCHGGFACNGIHKDDVINWLEDLLACY